jgi:hypothetical protein
VLIEGSSSGMVYADLEEILGIRLYTALQALSIEKVINSETDGNRKLFFSGNKENRQRQKSNRMSISVPNPGHPFNLLVVVDLLLAVINENADTIDKAFMLLKLRNHPYLTREEVEHIFEHYHLPGKKTEFGVAGRNDSGTYRRNPKALRKRAAIVRDTSPSRSARDILH